MLMRAADDPAFRSDPVFLSRFPDPRISAWLSDPNVTAQNVGNEIESHIQSGFKF